MDGLSKDRGLPQQQQSLRQAPGHRGAGDRPGYARVTKTVEPEDCNPIGKTHGGVYFSMADTACGSAAASYGYLAVTVSSQYNFLRSAVPGDTLTAQAREVKRGKTICVFDVRITDQQEKLLGTGSFTFYLLDQKTDV